MHNNDAVGQAHDFRQFTGNQNNRMTCVSVIENLCVNKFDGTDVNAAGWLTCNQQRRFCTQFACNNDFLCVTAGQRGYVAVDVADTDVKFLYRFVAFCVDVFTFQQTLAANFRVTVIAGDASGSSPRLGPRSRLS